MPNIPFFHCQGKLGPFSSMEWPVAGLQRDLQQNFGKRWVGENGFSKKVYGESGAYGQSPLCNEIGGMRPDQMHAQDFPGFSIRDDLGISGNLTDHMDFSDTSK